LQKNLESSKQRKSLILLDLHLETQQNIQFAFLIASIHQTSTFHQREQRSISPSMHIPLDAPPSIFSTLINHHNLKLNDERLVIRYKTKRHIQDKRFTAISQRSQPHSHEN
jgi:hypothetical protein